MDASHGAARPVVVRMVEGLKGHRRVTTAQAILRHQGRSHEGVTFATLAWVDSFHSRHVLEPTDDISPTECEARYYEQAAKA
jgi:hypothetical protein